MTQLFQGADVPPDRVFFGRWVEVVGSEVVVCSLVRPVMVRDFENGTRHGGDRLRRRITRRSRAPKVQPLVRMAAPAASVRAIRSHLQPFRVAPRLRWPALALFPGHGPAQLAKCLAVGKRVMSTPISATRTSAVRCATSGIALSRATVPAQGARWTSISVPRVAMASSR